MAEDLKRAALWYAAKGWPVFRLAPGAKVPMKDSAGHLEASTDAEIIAAWWAEAPNANIGIATGPAGLVVVDVDVKNGARGMESWRDLRAELALDDNTPTAETPTGGLHVYYGANGHSIKDSDGGLAEGVDICAASGYIVAPPSRTPAGEYTWALGCRPTDIELRPLPDALARALGQRQREKAPVIAGSIPEGARNATLASLAGSMRRRGASQGAIEAALLAENQECCTPPLDDAEVLAIAASISQYAPAPRDYHTSDLGNAERLIDFRGHDLRFCEPLGGWLVWDGRRWALDDTGTVQRMAQEVARALYVEAGQAPDAATRERLAKWGIATESAGRQRALLDLAWSQAGVAVAPSVFDADPLLLNCENGTIDLRTGELRPHDRDDLITRLAPVTFDPQARDPIFEGYLHDTTDGKADFAAYLQRAAGYTLTGLTDAECVFLVLGPGATGKSTLIEALLATLGDYGRKASFDTFLERGKGQVGAPRPDIASLRGARLVCAVETSGNRELAETVVKELSGGDTVTARYLFKPEFSYRPAFKLWLACNEAPKMTDTDTGLWRRLKRLPFEHVIASDAQDPAIKRHLTTDGRPAVLAWAVAGALAWQQSGLAEPTLVKDATAELRAEFDPLAEFLTARCTVRRGATELAGALRSAYESWAAEMGAKPIDNKEWGKRLRALGATTRRERLPEGQRSVWHGLELTPEGGGNDDSVHDVHNKPVFSKGSLVYTDLEIDLKNGVSTARCAQENADISAFDQRILDALAELGPQGGGYSTVAMKAHAQGPATRAALLRLAEAGLVVRAPGECYSLWPPRG